MDERTTIAAMALQGLLAGGFCDEASAAGAALIAVAYADALLAELHKHSLAPAPESAPPLADDARVPEKVVEEPEAWWGRVLDKDAAWHLWRDGSGEAECGEATDAELEMLSLNTGMDPEHVCLDCKDIDVQAHLAAAPAIHARPLPKKHRCAGFNKSAGVPCDTVHVHVEHEGKWFCKRHNPLKPKRARAA